MTAANRAVRYADSRSTSARLPWSPVVFNRGFDRLNALSDGVVAIAITLLVFPITDLATGAPGENVLTIVDRHSGKFVTFLITFLVIAKLWVDDHRLSRDVAGYTVALMWTHIIWLLSIVFLPFPMDVLSSADDTNFPNATVYVGTLLLATGALLIEYLIVARTDGLEMDGVNVRPGLIAAAVDAVAVLAAFVLTITTPQWGLRPLLLLLASAALGRLLGRRLGGRPTGDPDRDDR